MMQQTIPWSLQGYISKKCKCGHDIVSNRTVHLTKLTYFGIRRLDTLLFSHYQSNFSRSALIFLFQVKCLS